VCVCVGGEEVVKVMMPGRSLVWPPVSLPWLPRGRTVKPVMMPRVKSRVWTARTGRILLLTYLLVLSVGREAWKVL